MKRIIDAETYNGLVKLLSKDENVALFQKLVLSEKIEDEKNETKQTESEVK